jgi:SAM-dependent methyltransferase
MDDFDLLAFLLRGGFLLRRRTCSTAKGCEFLDWRKIVAEVEGQTETKPDMDRMAVLANLRRFDSEGTARCVDGSPVKHPSVRRVYRNLVGRVFETAKKYSETPRVLDLGAGEGSATVAFLELGAHVTAADISESQLAALAEKCGRFDARLDIRHEEARATLQGRTERYDIVVMNSFLHHIPDYLGLVRQAISVLRSRGQIFSFQDPLRYDTLRRGERLFSQAGYFFWRAFQGDYVQGVKTRIRRLRGIYIPGSREDDAEYHVTRNGVDQNAIIDVLEAAGFTCEVVRYFSTQSRSFQVLGEALAVKNTFAIIAQRTG